MPDIIAKARALRALGNIAAAGDLLTNELEKRGEDPALLNALALTERASTGIEMSEYGYLLRARHMLAESKGI